MTKKEESWEYALLEAIDLIHEDIEEIKEAIEELKKSKEPIVNLPQRSTLKWVRARMKE